MSDIRVGNISNVAGTGSPDITGGELCRARINFDGTGVISIRDSLNFSSVSDGGVGTYIGNFTTPFPNGSFSSDITATVVGNGTNGCWPAINTLAVGATGVSMLPTGSGLGGNVDTSLVTMACFGDKS